MTSLLAETALLEQLLTSRHVGVCLIDQSGLQVNLWSDDPELRSVLVEHQSQRIRELENGLNRTGGSARPVPYPVRELEACTLRPSAANDYYDPGERISAEQAETLFSSDGSGESTPGGQAGDDAAFAEGMAVFAHRVTTAGTNQPPTFLGS